MKMSSDEIAANETLAAKKGILNLVEKMLRLLPDHQAGSDQKTADETGRETPLLIAAKNGIVEMVDRILELYPVAIHDVNSEKKNIVLLAVENRQPDVYNLLLKREILKESIFHVVDHEGNSALHLAAKSNNRRPWRIPGAALQMQWEIKWYEVCSHLLSILQI